MSPRFATRPRPRPVPIEGSDNNGCASPLYFIFVYDKSPCGREIVVETVVFPSRGLDRLQIPFSEINWKANWKSGENVFEQSE